MKGFVNHNNKHEQKKMRHHQMFYCDLSKSFTFINTPPLPKYGERDGGIAT